MNRACRSAAGAEPRWHRARCLRSQSIPRGIRVLLLNSGSLTRRLQEACTGRFQVRLLSQVWHTPLHGETRQVGLRPGQWALVRQVLLTCDDEPWVYARSVIPPRVLVGRSRRLARLGTRSLGAVLFADRCTRRGEVEIAALAPGHRLFDIATEGLVRVPDTIWARRSVFRVMKRALLVSEVFLPAVIRRLA